MKKLKIKLEILYNIIFGKYKSFIIINVTKDNLVKLFENDEFDTDCMYYGLRPYVFMKLIKQAAKGISEEDLICEKAHFELSAEKKI